MKFFNQVLAIVALAATCSAVTDLREGVLRGTERGGPHGDEYDDYERVDPGQIVKFIRIRSADRIDYVGLDIDITSVEVHWGKYYRKTRVMYVKFTTNKNQTLEGGTPQRDTKKIVTEEAPIGHQLGGFFGHAGHELDSMGCIWTSIEPVEEI
ncbi:Hypothetical protein PHPALM_36647 [Phytophthora palmivora]|uniref:Jacalin-type lectin domain-containing protein n=1 Tax=Phytophthora palmivora TaxID=4796 RepID=A0A2P4WZE5_9STRA|nr:Hypothetical protein PHPALM_36647 [Phytophthora palmivora]